MSLDLIMGNAIFKTGIGLDVPVTDGLLSLGLAGNLFGVNLVDGGVAPTIVGNPTKLDDYTTLLGPSGYLDLNVKETESFTYFVISKLWNSGSGGNTQLIGTFQSYAADGTTSVVGSGIVFEAPGYRDVICSTYDGASGASSPNNQIITDVSDLPTTEATASWRCLVGCYDKTGVYASGATVRMKRIFDKTANKGSGSQVASDVQRDMRGNETIRWGTTNSRISQSKSIAHMGYAFYNRQLTQTEIDAMYARFKEIAALQGFTI